MLVGSGVSSSEVEEWDATTTTTWTTEVFHRLTGTNNHYAAVHTQNSRRFSLSPKAKSTRGRLGSPGVTFLLPGPPRTFLSPATHPYFAPFVMHIPNITTDNLNLKIQTFRQTFRSKLRLTWKRADVIKPAKCFTFPIVCETDAWIRVYVFSEPRIPYTPPGKTQCGTEI